MTVWIMQAGPQGAFAEFMLNENMLTIGWENIGNFADCQDRHQIFERIRPGLMHKGQAVVTRYATQILGFISLMAVGDLVLLRLYGQPIVRDREGRGRLPIQSGGRRVSAYQAREVAQQGSSSKVAGLGPEQGYVCCCMALSVER